MLSPARRLLIEDLGVCELYGFAFCPSCLLPDELIFLRLALNIACHMEIDVRVQEVSVKLVGFLCVHSAFGLPGFGCHPILAVNLPLSVVRGLYRTGFLKYSTYELFFPHVWGFGDHLTFQGSLLV